MMLMYLWVVSVETRCFTVSKTSWYDSLNVNSMPFLSISWSGAVEDESDSTNNDKYVIMSRNFWSLVGVSGEACCALH